MRVSRFEDVWLVMRMVFCYLGSKSDLDSICQLLNSLEKSSTTFIAKPDLLGSIATRLEGFPSLQRTRHAEDQSQSFAELLYTTSDSKGI